MLWESIPFAVIFQDKTSGNRKFLTSEYLKEGRLPIIDQGQSIIAGYTNDEAAACDITLPCILFGDHTKKFQFQNNKFALGADGLKALQVSDSVDKLFFFYFISNHVFPPNTGYSRHFKYLKTALLPLPPLNEQRRIAAKIEELQSRSKKATEALAEAEKLLAQLRQSVLHAAFTGKLTAAWREKQQLLLTSWKQVSLGQCIQSMRNGTSKRRGKEGAPIVVIRLADISDHKINTDNLRTVELTKDESAKYALQDGDLLAVRVNGSVDNVGKLILLKESVDWAFCDHLIRIRVEGSKILPAFLAYLSMTQDYKKHIRQNMVSSAGQNTINQTALESFEFTLPHKEEQQAIVDSLNTIFIRVEKSIIPALNRARSHLEQLDQSILAKAFRGELVPQDPKDEPASELLKRIKAEAATAAIKKRKRGD